MDIWKFFNDVGANIVAAAIASIALFLIAKFRRKIVFSLMRLVFPELRRSGLKIVHASMAAATENIVAAVERTHELKILSNKGTDWLGHDNAILSKSVSLRSVDNLTVFVLLLSQDAPWLKQWSLERNKSLSVIQDDLNSSHRIVESYIERQKNLRSGSGVLYYRDDPVWRLIITDDRTFVSSYANADQARDAAVFEYEGPNYEIYRGYKRYFEFLWKRRGIARHSIKESFAINTKYDNFELSAGAVVVSEIKGQKRMLLIERHDRTFTLPKGHVEHSEKRVDAAKREVHEETSLPTSSIKVVSELGFYPNPLLIGEKTKVFKIVYYYIFQYEGNDLPVVNPDHSHKSVRWYSKEEIAGIQYAYEHIPSVIQDAINVLRW
jgi:8-oxo-dGTP pyrophosphatase MutT (NUDIX family)